MISRALNNCRTDVIALDRKDEKLQLAENVR